MIVAQPTNNLANQMFTYASVKVIALDKKVDFKYFNKYATYAERKYSCIDKKYGQDSIQFLIFQQRSAYMNYR